MNACTKIKTIGVSISGAVGMWLDHVWQFFFFAFIFMLIDYITGLLAGRATTGLNSKKATSGLIKKIGFISLMVLGFMLDVALHTIIADFIELPFNLPLGVIISAWVIITESISVCENLERIGVPIPKFLLRILTKTQDKINNQNEEKNNVHD